MTTTKAKLEFIHAMARHTQATVRQCEALMRYAATLQRLAEDDCNIPADNAEMGRRIKKRNRIIDAVSAILRQLDDKEPGYGAAFSCDPRGAVLKIRVPDGYTNDFGGEGICVPA